MEDPSTLAGPTRAVAFPNIGEDDQANEANPPGQADGSTAVDGDNRPAKRVRFTGASKCKYLDNALILPYTYTHCIW